MGICEFMVGEQVSLSSVILNLPSVRLPIKTSKFIVDGEIVAPLAKGKIRSMKANA